MRLVPIPTTADYLEGSLKHWGPFVQAICARAGLDLHDTMDQIAAGEIQLHLVWDDAAKKAVALAGTALVKSAAGLVCKLIWCTGENRAEWFDLVDEIGLWAREHNGCVGMQAECRPGWKKQLEAKGYRMTHVVMERALKGH